jgi:hypothetical protein
MRKPLFLHRIFPIILQEGITLIKNKLPYTYSNNSAEGL